MTRSLGKAIPRAEGLVALKYLTHGTDMTLLENARQQRDVSQHLELYYVVVGVGVALSAMVGHITTVLRDSMSHLQHSCR